MKLSIGEVVAADIRKSGLSITYVAQQMGMSRKGLSDILKRDDMSLSQLASLSDILGKDYFELYKEKIKRERGIQLPEIAKDEMGEYVKSVKQDISVSLSIFGNLDTIRSEMPDFLSIINKEAESRGLYLG